MRQPAFTYSVRRRFAKHKERIRKIHEAGNSGYISWKKIDKTYFQHMAYQGCSETKRARLFLMNKIHSRKRTTVHDLWSSEPSETMPRRDDLYVHYLEWPGSSFLKESNESNSAICDNRLSRPMKKAKKRQKAGRKKMFLCRLNWLGATIKYFCTARGLHPLLFANGRHEIV